MYYFISHDLLLCLQGSCADKVEAKLAGGTENGLQFNFHAAVFAQGTKESAGNDISLGRIADNFLHGRQNNDFIGVAGSYACIAFGAGIGQRLA